MEDIKIAAPWILFYREIEALFKDDPEVRVEYDEENNVVKLYTDGLDKAAALEALLPTERTFGNVTVYITVIPANIESKSKVDLVKAAFRDNPAFRYAAVSAEGLFEASYVVMDKKVVQFPADNIQDIHGLRSTLYEDIARDVFDLGGEGIFFCTDAED